MFHYRDFKVTKKTALFNFIARYPFATIMMNLPHGEYPVEAYAPVIKAGNGLQFHIARANSAYPVFKDGSRVLVSFVGPNGHISPSWYKERFKDGGRSHTAPTWDYALVRARGVLRPMNERKLGAHLRRLVDKFEGALENGWNYKEIDPEFRKKLFNLIAGYDVEIKHMEGYFKLSQDQNDADRAHIQAELEARGQGFDGALAKLIGAKP